MLLARLADEFYDHILAERGRCGEDDGEAGESAEAGADPGAHEELLPSESFRVEPRGSKRHVSVWRDERS